MSHHPIFWGLVAGFFLGKMLFRWRWHRRAWAGDGGGCHGRRGQRGRFQGRGWGRHWRSEGGGAGGDTGTSTISISERLVRLARELELNMRQKQEMDEVFGQVREAFGTRFESWPHLDTVLAVVAADHFDRAPVEVAYADIADPALRKELIDGMEHLHNILTPEQRERLARAQ